jgi:hypothetical protein
MTHDYASLHTWADHKQIDILCYVTWSRAGQGIVHLVAHSIMANVVHRLSLSASATAKSSALAEPVQPTPAELPVPKVTHIHHSTPVGSGTYEDGGKARLVFVGTATCILEWYVRRRKTGRYAACQPNRLYLPS